MPHSADHSRPGKAAGSAVAGVVLGPGVAVPHDALRFSFVASSGPGGQNVNKRATKCQLRVFVADLGLSFEQTARLSDQARGQITDASELIITCDAHRSQAQNKSQTLDRLREIVLKAIVKPKRRIATKPTRGSRERRLASKHARSEIKTMRRATSE